MSCMCNHVAYMMISACFDAYTKKVLLRFVATPINFNLCNTDPSGIEETATTTATSMMVVKNDEGGIL